MSYPAWDSATSYAQGSIVTYNGQTYQATNFHDPGNNDPPNVEFGPGPYPTPNPVYGSLRAWTIWAELPTGYYQSAYSPVFFVLSRPFDPLDNYSGIAAEANPYGGDVLYYGQCVDHATGSINNPTIPCPAEKCGIQLSTGGGGVYGPMGENLYALTDPILYTFPSGQTVYIDGPGTPGVPRDLYIWLTFQGTYLFRRTFTIECELDGVVQSATVTPTDYNYVEGPPFEPFLQPPSPPGVYDAPYYSPGYEVVQFPYTLTYGQFKITAIEDND